MLVLLTLAIVFHGLVVYSGVQYLRAKHFAKLEHPHFVACFTAASTFFLLAHAVHLRDAAAQNVLWYALSIFNGQLYLALIRHYRHQDVHHAGV